MSSRSRSNIHTTGDCCQDAEQQENLEKQRDSASCHRSAGHRAGAGLLLAVPPLPEEGGEQAADHAAEEEEVQEQDDPGLQDSGGGRDQHEPGGQVKGEERAAVKAGAMVMLQVLQRQMDLELELMEGKEERKSAIGRSVLLFQLLLVLFLLHQLCW